MPMPNKLYDIAIERGVTREELVANSLREKGTVRGVAEDLGLSSHYTILNFLKKMGYVFDGNEWVGPDVSGKEKRDGVNVGSRHTAARTEKTLTSRYESERAVVSSQS